jgi:hypothetical protein
VADLVAVGVESNLGGHIQHLQARNADRVIGDGDAQPRVRFLPRLLLLLGVSRQQFHPPPQVVPQHYDLEGRLPASQSFCAVEKGDFSVSVLKEADDGALILRGYDCSGKPSTVSLALGGGRSARMVQTTNLLEGPGAEVRQPLSLAPQQIVTLRLVGSKSGPPS